MDDLEKQFEQALSDYVEEVVRRRIALLESGKRWSNDAIEVMHRENVVRMFREARKP